MPRLPLPRPSAGRLPASRAGAAGLPRRRLATTAAVLLAVLGAALLLSYVNGADGRARAGERLVDVLVVDQQVAAGTTGAEVAGSVGTRQVPARLVAAGALTSLAEVGSDVTNAALLPGEQVVRGRFSDPATYLPAGAVTVPAGMVEVSVSLDGQRAAGGVLKAGDEVGVQLTEQASTDTGVTAFSVWAQLPGVLVTRVVAPDSGTAADAGYTVTLALAPADAQKVVLGASATKAVWLTLEKAALGSAAETAGATTTVTTTTGGTK